MTKRRQLVSQRELARALRLSVQQVANLVARGMPRATSGPRPLYDQDKCWRWYVDFKTKHTQRQDRSDNESEARTRKLEADAMLTELAVLERQGNLVTVEYMAHQLERIAQRLRARILAVPGKWAPALVGCRTIQESQVRLEEAMAECLQAMSETGEDPELDTPPPTDAPTTPTSHNRPPGAPKVAGKTRRPAARRTRAAA